MKASALYNKLKNERQRFVDKAETIAAYTIPSLFSLNRGNHPSVEAPNQSIGAKLVQTLAAKMTLALFPANIPFFRFNLEGEALEQATPDQRSGFEQAAINLERAALKEFETGSMRNQLNFAMTNYAITGNFCLEDTGSGEIKVYQLDQYVLKRDANGDVKILIIEEVIESDELGEDILKHIDKSKLKMKDGKVVPVSMYKVVMFNHEMDKYEAWNEITDVILPDTIVTFKRDELPFVVPSVNRLPGENYNRAFAEPYLPDLIALEGMSTALLNAAMASSRVLPILSPNSLIDIDELQNAPNGQPIIGNPDDVKFLQLDKQADLNTSYNFLQDIERRLSFVFLVNTAIQRNAERVTAEEIRFMARDMEEIHGGLFSVLANELQKPIANLLIQRLHTNQNLPKLESLGLVPKIVTGIDALGRGTDLQNLQGFGSAMIGMLGPEAMSMLNMQEFVQRLANGYGIDSTNLVKSLEQIQAEQQQAQEGNLIEKLGPEALKQIGRQLDSQEDITNGGTN